MTAPSAYENADSRRLSTRQLAGLVTTMSSIVKQVQSGELLMLPGIAERDPYPSSSLTPAGSSLALPAAGSSLRTSSLIEAGPPKIEGLSQEEQDIADIEYAEKECWRNLEWVKRAKKPSAMAVANLMRVLFDAKEKKLRIREQHYKKKAVGMPAEWVALRDIIITALQPHPEALRAVVEAIGNR